METFRLKSMVDFVLNQKQSESFNEKTFINEALISLENIRNYTNFLKQPLKLEMFVPCDEDGNVISKFYSEKENTKNLTFSQLSNQYQIAETKVLFKGIEFEIIGGVNFLKINEDTFAFHDFNIKFKNLTVEFLVQYNLQLTESAIKQIGL